MSAFNDALKKIDMKLVAERYGEEYVAKLRYYIKQTNKIATGKLLRSIDYKIIKQATSYFVKIMSENYLEQVSTGIITKKVDESKIKKWVQVKGIKFGKLSDSSVAFLITRKLNKTKKFSPDWNNPSNVIPLAKEAAIQKLKGTLKLNETDKINLLNALKEELIIMSGPNVKINKK